MKRINKQTLKT